MSRSRQSVLEALANRPDHAMTAFELRDATGLSPDVVRYWLAKLEQDGLVVKRISARAQNRFAWVIVGDGSSAGVDDDLRDELADVIAVAADIEWPEDARRIANLVLDRFIVERKPS